MLNSAGTDAQSERSRCSISRGILIQLYNFLGHSLLSPFECLCGNFILPEPASYVFFYAVSNLRNLLYIMFGYRLSQKIYPQSLSAFGQKKNENAQRRSFFCVAVIPAISGRCAPKKKSGRNLSCGHGNSTGNRKSLTIRVQVGILRTPRLSCHKRYAQIPITSQLYHKILWLSRKGQLTATRISVLPEDTHTSEAAQNTAASGAGSRRAPMGLLFLWNVRFLSAGAHPAQCPPT